MGNYTTKDVPDLLLNNYYIKRDPKQVKAFFKDGHTIPELIQTFFNDQHTYYDATNNIEFEQYASEHLRPKCFYRVRVINKRRYMYLYIGTFIGLFNQPRYAALKQNYQTTIRNAIQTAEKFHIPLWVDLSQNQGGDQNVMISPFKLLQLLQQNKSNVVQVSGMTNSAGEMLAATLVYDYHFIRVGPRTSGSLSVSKNFLLDHGNAFLGVTIGHYTTPGGHKVSRFYL
jgi:hypothetical protein